MYNIDTITLFKNFSILYGAGTASCILAGLMFGIAAKFSPRTMTISYGKYTYYSSDVGIINGTLAGTALGIIWPVTFYYSKLKY